MKKYIILLITINNIIYCQGWFQFYDSNKALSVIQTDDSGYIYTGSLSLPFGNSSGYDLTIVKTDSEGNTCDYQETGSCFENENKWVFTYLDEYKSIGETIIKTSDGGYIVVGESSGDEDGSVIIIKISYNGQLEWAQKHLNNLTFGFEWSFHEFFYRFFINETDDNGFIISANATSNAVLIKINNIGELIWSEFFDYNGPGLFHASSVQQTNDGGYILTAFTSTALNPNSLVIKTDSYGQTCDYFDNNFCYEDEQKWVKSFPNTILREIQQTPDSSYLIIGGNSNLSSILAKLDSDGNSSDYSLSQNCYENENIWVKEYYSESNFSSTIAYSMYQTNDGGYVISGGNYLDGIFIIKTNYLGETCSPDVLGNCYFDENMWMKSIKFNNSNWLNAEYCYSIKQTNDNGYILAGDSEVENVSFLMKVDKDGKVCSDEYEFYNLNCYLQEDLNVLSELIELNNSLEGLHPLEIGFQIWSNSRLSYLDVSNKEITNIPSNIGNLDGLDVLYLSYNDISILPESLWELSQIDYLILNDNQISGQIPESICDFDNPSLVYMANNQLCPPYPNCLGNNLVIDYQDTSICNEYVMGDLNSDYMLDVLDIILMIDCILLNTCYDNSDISSDGLVNILDVVSLINIILDL